MAEYWHLDIVGGEEELEQFEPKPQGANGDISLDRILEILVTLTEEQRQQLCVDINVLVVKRLPVDIPSDIEESTLLPRDFTAACLALKIHKWQQLGLANCIAHLIFST